MNGSLSRRYLQAGHAKKLTPIIESLDDFDNNFEVWKPLRERIELVAMGWNELIGTCEDESARSMLTAQRDLCYDALRVQSDLFHAHRKTCVGALKLQLG